MTKTARTVLLVLLALTVAFIGLATAGWAWFDWNNHKKPTLIDTAVSPDGQYTLQLEQIGNPAFFGPATAHVTLYKTDTNHPLHTHSASVYTDGASLYPGNWAVKWEGDRVTVILTGCEQEDAPYTFHLTDQP